MRRCLHLVSVVTFFDGPEGKAWLEGRNGSFEILDRSTFDKLFDDEGIAAIGREITPGRTAGEMTDA